MSILRNKIILGTIIGGLILSNGYTYMNYKKESSKLTKLEENQKKLKSLIASSESYGTNEDIKIAFNSYGATNKIQYKGDSYFFDIQNIRSHTYDLGKKYQYVIYAKGGFLKDKTINGKSFLEDIMIDDLIDKYKKEEDKLQKLLSQGYSDEELNITDTHSLNKKRKIENEAKKDYYAYEGMYQLSFNYENFNVELTKKSSDSILKDFMIHIVLKDLDIKEDHINIVENDNHTKTIIVNFKNKDSRYIYNMETKKLEEENIG